MVGVKIWENGRGSSKVVGGTNLEKCSESTKVVGVSNFWENVGGLRKW